MKHFDPEEGVPAYMIALPEGALLVAIDRREDDDAEIAAPDSVLYPGDKAVVIAEHDVVDDGAPCSPICSVGAPVARPPAVRACCARRMPCAAPAARICCASVGPACFGCLDHSKAGPSRLRK